MPEHLLLSRHLDSISGRSVDWCYLPAISTPSSAWHIPTTCRQTRIFCALVSRQPVSPKQRSRSASSRTSSSMSVASGQNGKSGSIASRTSRPSSSWCRSASMTRCCTKMRASYVLLLPRPVGPMLSFLIESYARGSHALRLDLQFTVVCQDIHRELCTQLPRCPVLIICCGTRFCS